ncbi:MAG: response regulator transcription factor, partial [Marichromatium sp.]|nr:response regulator transcription factor [Marichromatium sp.]
KDSIGLYGLLEKYPDALILVYDTFFKNSTLVEELRKIRSDFSMAKVIILSDNPLLESARPLLLEGIFGYANARLSGIHLRQAIAVARAGSVWLPPEFLRQMINQIPEPTALKPEIEKLLSPRELEISKYVAKGYSNKEIAKAAFISEHTVKAHLRTIFEKLEVGDRLALALKLR